VPEEMAQVVEHLPSKHKALGSKSSIAKRNSVLIISCGTMLNKLILNVNQN
jgi:hypothetical protein